MAACVANRARAALTRRFSEAIPLRGIRSASKKDGAFRCFYMFKQQVVKLDKIDKFFDQNC